MLVRTVVVEPKDVNATTAAAQALWAALWVATAVNEDANRVDAQLMKEYTKFGPWRQRLDMGIAALTAFYRSWYGDKAASLIGEYFDAKYRSETQRFKEIRRKLVALHDGYIVDDYRILRVTDEPVREVQ